MYLTLAESWTAVWQGQFAQASDQESDDEESSASSNNAHLSDSEHTQPLWYRRLPVMGLAIAAVSVLCLVAITSLDGAAQLFGLRPARRSMSAAEMFEGRRLANVIAQNLVSLASLNSETSLPTAEDIQGHVEEGLRRISSSIRERSPDLHRQLQEFQLTPDEQDGLIALMGSTRDPRVQNLGRSLSEAMQPKLDNSSDVEGLRRDIEAKLSPQLQELFQLRGEIVPSVLHPGANTSGGWNVGIDPEKMHLLGSFKKWHLEMEMSNPELGKAVNLEGRRLDMTTVSWDAIQSQGVMFLSRAQAYFSSFPKVYDVLFEGDYYGKFKACAKSSIKDMDMSGLMTCWSVYSNAALDALESLVQQKTSNNIGRMGFSKSTSQPTPSPWRSSESPTPTAASLVKSAKSLMAEVGLPGFDIFG